jgi:AcrR family transcriptional regulator
MPRKRRRVLIPSVRRAELIAAAINVFSHKGYRRASISDIISVAGVARGTFYLYFSSKEEVFRAIIDDFHGLMRRQLDHVGEVPHFGTDARESLLLGFKGWLQTFADNRQAARIVLREASAIDARFERGYAALRRSAIGALTRRVRQLQDLGLARAAVPPQVVAFVELGMLEEAVKSLVLDDPGPDLTALAEALVDLHWSGLRPD